MLLASVFFALMNVSVKFIPHIPAIEIVWFRSVFSAVFTVLVLRQKGIPLFGTHKLSLVARGIVGSISLILFFYTLQRIPLATAVTLQYLSPIFTTILGIFILKEKVRARQFVYFGLAFAGVLLIQGVDPRVDGLSAALGLTSAPNSQMSAMAIYAASQSPISSMSILSLGQMGGPYAKNRLSMGTWYPH